MGAIAASGAGLSLHDQPVVVIIAGMIVAGLVAGAAWHHRGPVACLSQHQRDHHDTDAQLRRGLVLSYLIFDSRSFWRDLTSSSGPRVPQGRAALRRGRLAWRFHRAGSGFSDCDSFGFLLGVAVAAVVWAMYSSTSSVLTRACWVIRSRRRRYAGIKTRV